MDVVTKKILGKPNPSVGTTDTVMGYNKLIYNQIGQDEPVLADRTSVMNYLKLIEDTGSNPAPYTPGIRAMGLDVGATAVNLTQTNNVITPTNAPFAGYLLKQMSRINLDRLTFPKIYKPANTKCQVDVCGAQVLSGNFVATTTSKVTLPAGASSVNDYYKDDVILVTSDGAVVETTITASGNWTVPADIEYAEVFLCGAGGAGGNNGGGSSGAAGGGGGGRTKSYKIVKTLPSDGDAIQVTPGQVIPIIVGATSGALSQFLNTSYQALGGDSGQGPSGTGGAAGGAGGSGGGGGGYSGSSGGAGGTNGGSGSNGSGSVPGTGGAGQAFTTSLFGESITFYGAGGNGGGAGTGNGAAGGANTGKGGGGGGGGASTTGGVGGSGIVIIRTKVLSKGKLGIISSYNGTTKEATLKQTLTSKYAPTASFALYDGIAADVEPGFDLKTIDYTVYPTINIIASLEKQAGATASPSMGVPVVTSIEKDWVLQPPISAQSAATPAWATILSTTGRTKLNDVLIYAGTNAVSLRITVDGVSYTPSLPVCSGNGNLVINFDVECASSILVEAQSGGASTGYIHAFYSK